MSSTPSIKGSVMSGVVEAVAKLVGRGDLTREELARRLAPEDLALLDSNLLASSWYDIRSYDRMNAVLLEVEGQGDPEYYREQGRKTAQRLKDAGIYAQLEYLSRTGVAQHRDPKARYEAFGHDLRLLASLSASILNFSRWSSRPDPEHPDRYRLEVSEAEAMPESLCWRSDGFVNGMASIHGHEDLWRWTRPTRDLVLFHMLRAP